MNALLWFSSLCTSIKRYLNIVLRVRTTIVILYVTLLWRHRDKVSCPGRHCNIHVTKTFVTSASVVVWAKNIEEHIKPRWFYKLKLFMMILRVFWMLLSVNIFSIIGLILFTQTKPYFNKTVLHHITTLMLEFFQWPISLGGRLPVSI